MKPLLKDEKAVIHRFNAKVSKSRNEIYLSTGIDISLERNQWQNAYRHFEEMTLAEYRNRPNKTSYHNLCTVLSPPQGLGSLLGLGHKFCVQTSKPSLSIIHHSCARWTRDVRLKYTFAGSSNNGYEKKIYIPSLWQPKPGSEELERAIHNFTTTVTNDTTGGIHTCARCCAPCHRTACSRRF